MTADRTNEGEVKIRLTAGGAVAAHCLGLHEGTKCGGLDWNKVKGEEEEQEEEE